MSSVEPAIELSLVAPTDPAAADILQTHRAHSTCHCPTTSRHSLATSRLAELGVALVIARRSGETVGVGGLRERAEAGAAYGEVKSMHTLPSARGLGVGDRILSALIELAAQRRYSILRLETGSEAVYAPARRLYERNGFTYCVPFADYEPDPLSVFMERAADAADAAR